MTVNPRHSGIRIFTDTGWNVIDHGTFGSCKTRVLRSILAAGSHGIFAFQADKSVGTGTMLDIFIVGYIETHVS